MAQYQIQEVHQDRYLPVDLPDALERPWGKDLTTKDHIKAGNRACVVVNCAEVGAHSFDTSSPASQGHAPATQSDIPSALQVHQDRHLPVDLPDAIQRPWGKDFITKDHIKPGNRACVLVNCTEDGATTSFGGLTNPTSKLRFTPLVHSVMPGFKITANFTVVEFTSDNVNLWRTLTRLCPTAPSTGTYYNISFRLPEATEQWSRRNSFLSCRSKPDDISKGAVLQTQVLQWLQGFEEQAYKVEVFIERGYPDLRYSMPYWQGLLGRRQQLKDMDAPACNEWYLTRFPQYIEGKQFGGGYQGFVVDPTTLPIYPWLQDPKKPGKYGDLFTENYVLEHPQFSKALTDFYNAPGKTFRCDFKRGTASTTWRISVGLSIPSVQEEDEHELMLPRNGSKVYLTIIKPGLAWEPRDTWEATVYHSNKPAQALILVLRNPQGRMANGLTEGV
ncbi:hypothetical protein BDV96DRAFT_644771 [Lophiotrema nucula]|uniref:Uncharacterized protein n=1 Tax=Lophiotrema nucula TaxID=690887 RepID=A0A6A5ZF43_9PLEO|nr:hypothetical protein BDV96DRAFT_644771 [Lophiotrema nucula]